MADTNANIKVNIDTSNALSSIKLLQSQISAFHTQMSKSGAQAAAESAKIQQGLLNSLNASGKFNASIQNIKTSTESFTTALEKNKLSMGEYFRYSIASSRSFGKTFATEFETINKVARERVKTLQTQYIQLGRDANGAMKAIAVRPLVLDLENLGTKTQIAAQRQQILNQLLKQGSTNLLNFGKNTQWAGRQLMVGFTIPLTMAGAAAAKSYMQIEQASIQFKRVYGDINTTAKQANDMAKQIQGLAASYTKYGVAVADTMDMAAKAAAMGKTGADLLAQVDQATKLSVLGGVDQKTALDTTISLTNAFGISADKLSQKINFLNSVENQTVLSIEDMTTAIPKAAPVIQQLGGSVEDLTYFLTAMREGGVNAAEGANALKSGLASIINPTKAASDFLGGFGINVKKIVSDDKGNLKKTVLDFANSLNTLDPLNRAKAIEMMFGKFQFARMSTLFKNITDQGSQASKVMGIAIQSPIQLAAMANKELEKVQSSPMYKFQKALADIQLKIAPIGESILKILSPIMDFAAKALDGFNHLGAGFKNFIIVGGAIGGIIAPALLMVIGLVANGAANILKFFTMIKTFFNKTATASTVLGEQTNYMTEEQLRAMSVAASLEQAHNTLTQAFTSERESVDLLIAAYQKATLAQEVFMGVPRTKVGAPATSKKFATGGIVSGPGTGTSDSISAMISNGEAVIPAASVAKHPGLVNQLINGSVPQFASGYFPSTPYRSAAQIAQAERAKEAAAARAATPEGRAKAARAEAILSSERPHALYIDISRVAKLPADSPILKEIAAAQFTKQILLGTPTGAYGEYRTSPAFMMLRTAGLKENRYKTVNKNNFKDLMKKYKMSTWDMAGIPKHYWTDSPRKYASGGLISGPGNGTSDSIPAMLSNGEAVIPAAAVARNPKLVRSLISGNIPRFSQGTPDVSIYGGPERMLSPYTLNAPGNTPGGFGIAKSQIGSKDFINELRKSIMAATLSESGTRTSQTSIDKLYTPSTKSAIKIAKLLEKGLTELGDEAKHINDVVKLKSKEINAIFEQTSKSLPSKERKAMVVGSQKLLDPTLEDVKTSGYARVPAIRFNPETGELSKRGGSSYSNITGKAASFTSKYKTISKYFPDYNVDGLRKTQAHLGPEDLSAIGGFAKLQGRGMAFPETNTKALEKIKNMSEKFAEKTGQELPKNWFDSLIKGFNVATKRNSPPKEAIKAGKDYGNALNDSLQKEVPKTEKVAKQLGTSFFKPVETAIISGQAKVAASSSNISSIIAKSGGDYGIAFTKQNLKLVDGIRNQWNSGLIEVKNATQKSFRGITDVIVSSIKSRTAQVAGSSDLYADDQPSSGGRMSRIMGSVKGMGSKISNAASNLSTGKLAGLGMAASMAASSLTMIPGPVGELANQMMPLISTVSMLIPTLAMMGVEVGALALPLIGVAAAIGAGILIYNAINDAKKKELAQVNNTINAYKNASNALDELGQLSGTTPRASLLSTSQSASKIGVSGRQANDVNILLQSQQFKDPTSSISKMIGNIKNMSNSAASQFLSSYANSLKGFGFDSKTIDSMLRAIEIQAGKTDLNLKFASVSISTAKGQKELAKQTASDIQAAGNNKAELDKEGKKRRDSLKEANANVARLQAALDTAKRNNRLQPSYSNQAKENMAQSALITAQKQQEIAKKYAQSTISGPAFDKMKAAVASGSKGLLQNIQSIDMQFASGQLSKKAYKESLASIYSQYDKISEKSGKYSQANRILQKSFGEFSTPVKKAAGQINDLGQKFKYLQITTANGKLGASIANEIAHAGEKGHKTMAQIQAEIDAVYKKLGLDPKNVVDYVSQVDNQQGGTGGPASSGLDSIVQKLREVQSNQTKMTTGWAASLKAIKDFASGARKALGSPFSGIQQDLLKVRGGASKSFIDMILGMTPEEYNKQKNNLFVFKKGNIVGLKQNAKDIQTALSAGSVGTFQADALQQVKDYGYKQTAIRKLTAAGLDLKTATDMASDSELAYAIATRATTKDVATMVKVKKELLRINQEEAMGTLITNAKQQATDVKNQAAAYTKLVAAGLSSANAYALVANATDAATIAAETDATKIKILADAYTVATAAAKDFAAAQAVNASNDAFAEKLNGVNYLLNNMAKYTKDQIAAILADPNLMHLVLNPSIDPVALQTALDNASQSLTLEIKSLLLTDPIAAIDKMLSPVNQGIANALEKLGAMKQQIELAYQSQEKPIQDQIQVYQDQIDALNKQISEWNYGLKQIERQEKVINDSYDLKYKALDKISKVNEKITKQEKSQLDIAEALSQGDIAQAAKAAQDMRAQQATDAIDAQRTALDNMKQAELDALNVNGQTRKQIEAAIADTEFKILTIQQTQLQPLQDQITALEKQKKIQEEALTVLGKTELQWQQMQADMATLKTGTDAFASSISTAYDNFLKLADLIAQVKAGGTVTAGQIGSALGYDLSSTTVTQDTQTPAFQKVGWANGTLSPYQAGQAYSWTAYVSAADAASGNYTTLYTDATGSSIFHPPSLPGLASGGFVPNMKFFATGGYSKGTDTIPAMLTPGEFVVKRSAVDRIGSQALETINAGGKYKGEEDEAKESNTMYNSYELNVHVKTDADADTIARTVITKIRDLDAQRLRSNRY